MCLMAAEFSCNCKTCLLILLMHLMIEKKKSKLNYSMFLRFEGQKIKKTLKLSNLLIIK